MNLQNTPVNKNVKLPFFRSMRGKLLLWFLLLALIPLVVVGVLAYVQAQNALQQAAYDKLEAVQAIVMAVSGGQVRAQLAEARQHAPGTQPGP